MIYQNTKSVNPLGKRNNRIAFACRFKSFLNDEINIKASKMYYSDCGIIHSLNVRLNEGQLVENFVIAELEKRRKIGLITTDQFYYYKSTSGREIDLVFEVDDTLYAVEIKATTKPGAKDFRNLKEFGKKMNLEPKRF